MEKKLIRILSFSRKWESGKFKEFWTPAFAGVTFFKLFTRLLSVAYDNILGKIVSLINNPKHWLLPGAKLR
jgi:hypothetical protein